MAICPKCGAPFSYEAPHVCEGRDKTKMWALLSVGMGAFIGVPLGQWYGQYAIGQACDKPDATNLCGLSVLPALPFYIVIGAVIGASVAAFAAVVVLGRRKA